jgi:TorA maturation chaperone TorD
MQSYQIFAKAFSYPSPKFFSFFSEFASSTFAEHLAKEEAIQGEYDRLFRANEIWLYTLEHSSYSELERPQKLADILAFYQAFGVEAQRDRADALPQTLEFMQLLILKELHARQTQIPQAEEKAQICQEAQQKFFQEYLYAPGKKIAEIILAQSTNSFYKEVATEFQQFLEDEKERLGIA